MNDFIQNKVIPFAQKIENNFILSAISGAFMKVMPALLGGAVFSLFRVYHWETGIQIFYRLLEYLML